MFAAQFDMFVFGLLSLMIFLTFWNLIRETFISPLAQLVARFSLVVCAGWLLLYTGRIYSIIEGWYLG